MRFQKKNPSKYHIFKKKVDDATSVLLWYVFDSLSILLKRDFILFRLKEISFYFAG